MKIQSIELFLVRLDLQLPFTTSFGTYTVLHHPFVKITSDENITGWGEVPTLPNPAYKPESDHISVWNSLTQFVVPSIMEHQKNHGWFSSVEDLIASYSWIKGANFAKSGVEAAFWDILAQQKNKPLWKIVGGTKRTFPVGVSIGGKTVNEVMNKAEQAVKHGYQRLKVKVWPGFEYDVTQAVRSHFPAIQLQLDANSSYTHENWELLKKVDIFNLLLIEQPLYDDDVVFHAQISAQLKTPICLDESIHSLHDTQRAHLLWKTFADPRKLIINIKPPRVSGIRESITIAQFCKKNGIKTWIGGMLDSALGKLANLHFNARDDIDLPGDHFSPTGSYFKRDALEQPPTSENGVYTLSNSDSYGQVVDEVRIRSMSADHSKFVIG